MFSAPPPATLCKCRGSLSIALAHEERKFSRLAMLCPFKQSHAQEFCAWVSDLAIMCLIAYWSGLVYNLGAILDLLIWLCLPCDRADRQFAHCVHARSCLSTCVTSPLFIYLFICLFHYFVWLHSPFFCHFQSCRSVRADRLRLCVHTLSPVRH